MQKFDLIIIGSGPAGKTAAIQAAKLGKNAAIVDGLNQVGGVCVHTGTIPSKTLRETVLNLTGWRERGFYGRAYRVKADIQAHDLMQRLNLTLQSEVDIQQDHLVRNGVHIIQGHARFVSENVVDVATSNGDTVSLTAEKFILAVGTKTYRPDYVPFNGETIIDSDEVTCMKKLPRSLTVIGAGVVGVEYATIFKTLDIECRKNGSCIVRLDSNRAIGSDMVLFAAGRVGATDDLGLDKLGIEVDHRGRLSVNDKFQTSAPHVYAAGDVIGFPSLASTSLEQGRIAVLDALGEKVHKVPEFFPYGIYAVPEMSSVGMSEEEIIKRKIPYEIGIMQLRETSRGKVMGLQSGLMKMIFSIKSRRLLGVHIVGEGATELIHIGQAVLTLKGTLDYFLENAFNYPTLAEAYKVAALHAHNRMMALEE
jgi:NAD(P) transhydrogenase